MTKLEMETVILYNEEENIAEVYTEDKKLQVKLTRLAEKYPEQICATGKNSFTVPKNCVSIREPYSEERRRRASERARSAGYRPPVRRKD